MINLLTPTKRSKYGNIKTVYDGIPFDSIAEKDRYVILKGLERAGEIHSLDLQHRFRMESYNNVFTRTADTAIAELLSGRIYEDNRGLSSRIWRVGNGFRDDVNYMLDQGLAQHKSAAELADDLRKYVKPSAAKDWEWRKVYPRVGNRRVDYNAQRLARTAINHAYFLSNVKAAKANPFVDAIHWQLSPQHWERQVYPFGPDECDEFSEFTGDGLGAGNFKPENVPLPHPQCLCNQQPVVYKSNEEVGREIGDWLAGGQNAKLDQWYSENFGAEPDAPPKGGVFAPYLTEQETSWTNAWDDDKIEDDPLAKMRKAIKGRMDFLNDAQKKEFESIMSGWDKETTKLYDLLSGNFKGSNYKYIAPPDEPKAYYDSLSKIFMNISDNSRDLYYSDSATAGWHTMFHEQGHQLDHLLGIFYQRSLSAEFTDPKKYYGKNFADAIKTDVMTALNKSITALYPDNPEYLFQHLTVSPIKGDKELIAVLRHVLNFNFLIFDDNRLLLDYSAFTDAVGLASEGRIPTMQRAGAYAHGDDYNLKQGTAGATSETFATMFSAYLRGNAQEIKNISGAMPNAWAVFNDMINRIRQDVGSMSLRY